MATTILTENNSLANIFISELRDTEIQKDAMRFRRNTERLGEIMAYEISKTLHYGPVETENPLGVSKDMGLLDKVVLATVLRAGLPMHQGFLSYFDKAENAFVSAQRKMHKSGTFEIEMNKVTSPDLNDKVLILCDPMLATGASMDLALKALTEFGQPKEIHVCTLIASRAGLDHIQRLNPNAHIWIGDLDEELTAKSYIVPGLGDAGDLAFGPKI